MLTYKQGSVFWKAEKAEKVEFLVSKLSKRNVSSLQLICPSRLYSTLVVCTFSLNTRLWLGNSDEPQLPTEAHKMRLWQKVVSVILTSAGLLLNLKITNKILLVHDLRRPLFFELFTHALLSIVSLLLCILSQMSGVFLVESLVPCKLGYFAGVIG